MKAAKTTPTPETATDEKQVDLMARAIVRAREIIAEPTRLAREGLAAAERAAQERNRRIREQQAASSYEFDPADLTHAEIERERLSWAWVDTRFEDDDRFAQANGHWLVANARTDRRIVFGDPDYGHAVRTSGQQDDLTARAWWWAGSHSAWAWLEERLPKPVAEGMGDFTSRLILLSEDGFEIYVRQPHGWGRWDWRHDLEKHNSARAVEAAKRAERVAHDRRRELGRQLLDQHPDLVIAMAEKLGFVDANGHIKKGGM